MPKILSSNHPQNEATRKIFGIVVLLVLRPGNEEISVIRPTLFEAMTWRALALQGAVRSLQYLLCS